MTVSSAASNNTACSGDVGSSVSSSSATSSYMAGSETATASIARVRTAKDRLNLFIQQVYLKKCSK